MLIYPSMLVPAAAEAGIPIPPEEQLEDLNLFRESHPQFFVLCITQLGRRMDHGEHWDNAKALAKIPVEELKTLTVDELQARGVNCGA